MYLLSVFDYPYTPSESQFVGDFVFLKSYRIMANCDSYGFPYLSK